LDRPVDETPTTRYQDKALMSNSI